MAESPSLYEPSFEHDACGFGFVCDIAGRPSHGIVRDALTVLVNLEHRGASGSERNTGDGAGILAQVPFGFLGTVAAEQGLGLPGAGGYGVGMVFLPRDEASRTACEGHVAKVLLTEGLELLGWRDVPTETAGLGETARASQPVIRQVFVGRPADVADDLAFDRRLYVARRLVEKAVSRSALPGRGDFYVSSLSCRTIVYKGMLNASQLRTFYPDIVDPRFESAIAMVHSRFSTNTFPSWARAHPYRYISHNGEINTLRGNVNWIHARQSMFRSSLFGDDLQKVLPAVDTEGSDSAILDNVLELLHLSGRSLAHGMMMLVPEPWNRDETMSPERRAFYEYHACLMEPWDGPASIAFTDGVRVGATLDRNGLRPARYYVTDGRPGRHGVGGRRPGHPGRPGGGQGPAPARPHVPRGHGRGADRLRRGAEGDGRLGPALRGVDPAVADPDRRTFPTRPTSSSRTTRPSCGARRSSATTPRTCA